MKFNISPTNRDEIFNKASIDQVKASVNTSIHLSEITGMKIKMTDIVFVEE